MKVFINTGGKGERLFPLTKELPKPMVSIGGKPILHHLIDWVKKNGLNEVVMMNGYKSEKVIDYFKDGSHLGLNIAHSNEPYPLMSGGPLRYAKNHVSGTCVYISGDVMCDVDLNKMFTFHKEKKADMTIHVHPSTHPQDSDIIQVNEEGRVIRFIKKNKDHEGAGNLSNSGLSILEPKIFDLMKDEVFVFEHYLYPRLLEANANFFAYNTDEFMIDVGTHDRLQKCEAYLKSKLGAEI